MSTVDVIAIAIFNTALGAYMYGLDGAIIAFISTIAIHVVVDYYTKDKQC